MKNLMIAVAATVLFAAPTFGLAFGLACEYPERPTLPDGGTAPKEDMIAAQAAVKAFLAAVDEYLDCIEQEEKDAIAAIDNPDEETDNPDEETIKRRDELLSKRFDAANEEKFLFGEKWNQQVRAYNAQKSGQDSE
jgi:hypothetical protein